MADVKISELPAASTPLAGTEQIPLVQDATTKQITVSNLLTSANLGTPSAINLANATNVPMDEASGVLAVANGGTGTATPALVQGTNVTITGTWPNQTINSTYSGAVTSVSAALPVVSSGGTTPQISMAAATTSVNGYLTSTDWTTFNSKLTSGGPLGTPSSGTATNLTGLPLTTGVTGLLPVANGGTGTATPNLVAGSNVTISGTWPNQTIAAAGAAQVYPGAGIANSTGSAWGTSYSTTGSGTVLALATSPTFVTPALGVPASGDFSTGTFTWPTFNQNTSGTAAGLSATLAVASGGTGQTSYTDGQLLIGNSTGNTLTKATLTAGANITITNSAGGITIAAAGGGGSGTVTSVSGTGTVNGLTLTGTVTTSGSLTLGGTLDLSSPPAIGGTAAAAGAFTTLSASSTVTISGGTANGVTYLNGSKVLTSGSALTFDGTNLTVSNAGAMGFEVRPNSGDYSGGTNLLSYNRATSAWAPLGQFASYFAWQVNASEVGRWTSTGLGIGTSSPQNLLNVVKASNNTSPASTAGIAIQSDSGTTYSAGLHFGTDKANSVSYIQSDSSASYTAIPLVINPQGGNLGLGVTPSAWATFTGLQVGALGGVNIGGATGDNFYAMNAYYNTGWKYAATGYTALMYRMVNGEHRWSNAPSGTAGNAISFTQAMTLDASGNLLLGTTTLSEKLSMVSSGAASTGIQLNQTGSGGHDYRIASTGTGYGSAGNLIIYDATAGAERARITSGGYFKASNSGSYDNSSGTYHELYQNADSRTVFITANSASLTTDGIEYIYAARNTTNNSFYAISYYNGGAGAYKFRVADSGNVTNANNSYGAISDVKLKENIVDASPKLADLMQVQVRNYNLIGETTKQLGVVAQELEQVFPSMVDESPDRDEQGNDLGTTTKSVKYSVFVPMLIKAFQEQQAIIESLKARLDAANL